MKSKALTYVMLIVVGIIWYQVFFRVKDNLMGEDAAVPKPNESLASVRIIYRDTVDLHVDYRDPFRYEKFVRPISLASDLNKPIQKTRKVQQRPQKPQFVWPKITYHGLIRNRSSKEPLALIRVDGFVYNLRAGDEIFNGIYIRSIDKEELIIQYKKDQKSIWRD